MAELNEQIITSLESDAYKYVSMASGVEVNIFQSPVTISKIIVNSASTPFTAYDNASGASGGVFLTAASSATPQTLLVGAKLLEGLTIVGPAIDTPSLTITYR